MCPNSTCHVGHQVIQAAMSECVLRHDLSGEEQRLALMSHLLDPLERAHLQQLGLRAGWRCLEAGCGNGSISQWLATPGCAEWARGIGCKQ